MGWTVTAYKRVPRVTGLHTPDKGAKGAREAWEWFETSER